MPAIIDMHAHYVAPELIDEAERNGASYGVRIVRDDAGRRQLRFDDGTVLRPFFPELCDLAIRLPLLDETGVAEQILSTWTDMAGDNLPPAQGARWARLQNDTLAANAGRHAPRFSAMGTLPMQDVGLAVAELDYIANRLGLRSVEIGTNINGRDLDDADFRPLWQRLRDLDMVVLLHPPLRPVGAPRTGEFFLNNLIGYPTDTTIAAARLLFSGLFQELPGLKICLAHGGGFLPYQIGRLDRGFAAHPACSKRLTAAPSDLLRAFHYDSLTHNTGALAFLLGMVGADRVVYGSDYPFEMLDASGPARILDLPLGQAPRDAILGGTMRALLHGAP